MRLVYLADTQIPSRATNGTQIVRMCSALASHGVEVTLVHPHRFGNAPEGFHGDPWLFYGVQHHFRIITLPTPLTLSLSRRQSFARVARGLPLAAFVFWRARPFSEPFVFYCRSMLGAWLALRARRLWGRRSSCAGVFLEIHDAPPTGSAWEIVRSVDGLATNTDALRAHVCAAEPDLAEGTITARNGFDPAQFDTLSLSSRRTLRARLGLDDDTTLVAYTGRVNTDKGVPTILDAANRLQDRPVQFLLVGKVYDDIGERAAPIPNVHLTGFVPPADVAKWIWAADLLVMPTSARISYVNFTCPLKLFEYMASGRPVLCSDLPVLKEVVADGVNARLFRADDAESLAAGIEHLRTDRSLSDSLAHAAKASVTQYTWERRAEQVVSFIERRTSARVDGGDRRG